MFCLALVCCVAYCVDMYISRASWPSTNGKSYQSIYLRESYRDGPHVRKRNIANLTHCDPKEIAAIELALRHKNNLAALASLEQIECSKAPPAGTLGPSSQWAYSSVWRNDWGSSFSGPRPLRERLCRAWQRGRPLCA